MNINGYKKSKYNKFSCKNNDYNYNQNLNYCYNNPLKNLYEVEKFLCNFKKIFKCINLYKFLK